jgi:hypothetical protein
VIALIGIANTLALSVHERTREVGLLRAVGMQRRQLRRAVRWEAVLIAVLGATLGAVLAVGGAWSIVAELDEEGVTQLTLPVAQLAVILGMAGVAGVLAATGPARRAARLDVLDAIASDLVTRCRRGRCPPTPCGPGRLRSPSGTTRAPSRVRTRAAASGSRARRPAVPSSSAMVGRES